MPITIRQGNGIFVYRVAAVFLDGADVLLHRAVRDDFWSLPGGRCEFLEESGVALRREMGEEMGVDVEILRPVWAVEGFFQDGERRYHELGFYYLAALPPGFRAQRGERFLGDEEGIELIFEWFPIASLPEVRLYPEFLRKALADIPDRLERMVFRERMEPPSG